MRRFLFLLCLFSLSTVYASDDLHRFANKTDEIRYQTLIQEIRCVVCQGQNIADSNAPLANDLRNKVSLMINNMKSDDEIEQYLVKRYGEYILYKPRLTSLTVLLWSFPFLCIALILSFFGYRTFSA